MKRKFSQIRIIALGYISIIIIGTLLLMLPFASQSGESAGFVPALFTAVSSSCVTGLIVLDTATSWSLFGQAVIITLIQIGGLGFMTIATMFSMLLKRKMGLREREIMVLRFGLDGKDEQTQKEVADNLNISQSYISRLEKKIVNQIKKEMLKICS